jgi:hypothetical protein
LTDKLNILVRVDLDHARAQVLTKGHVTVHSIQALYVVVKRANSLKEGLNLELDMRGAHVDPEALEELHTCSQTHHLPAATSMNLTSQVALGRADELWIRRPAQHIGGVVAHLVRHPATRVRKIGLLRDGTKRKNLCL